MKKYFIYLFSLIIFSCIVTALDCPRDEVLCEGKCGLFTDINTDGLCDLSEEVQKETINLTVQAEIVGSQTQTQARKVFNGYYFISVTLFLVVLYILTWFLSKSGIINLFNHRRFWNVLLLLTFLGCAISGLLLVLRINYGINIIWPFNLLFWHVETGIAMAIISIFHIIWHTSYYTSIVLKGKK